MPQMSPLFWAPLFILASAMFIFSMIKLFFLSLKTVNYTQPESTLNKMMNWKW